ncbi:MAG: protoheme IX farnesyltransferase [Deltaproteobacteria bacterium RIFCSPLOWO2_12_FULL_44_12]|nr:MAG: protoheme IX farnesyltransferase [Deltaproteobacteria bacterium RIFCSPHIGHO2_01_FULL_43_49]OGQ14918.1 MAG: protoheme IX farnesyltransferase [Deltaproteobacteria bacterium RIFCSPHIGHO2_02_FULL_44_53]OGQ29578.1 MAG: protoheme IX farnesyltransferase [Deltaproteobacteria bacterium RIFCSPHIGHO2_12_FULL_44_21]OGQ31030.1 MAG: protoheme IX farnesyltransferase [Deltaproteobacteria bacterium RIFCSPLOWO2_01_FULL_45_74]OGQ42632.1 MAG: protoheme IX farnesyltransferase [Deltaproteobacteria bacterium 
MNFVASLNNYISLTKPTIVMSFAITGLTAMVVEGSLLQEPFKFFFIVLAIVFTAASANAFNQYFERDLDAQMERTRNRRPLPQNKIKPSHALIFSILIGFIAVFYLSFWVNFLSAAVALGTIVFYAFFYTLWLKPRTPYNIVIGGAAGATAPLIGWAAATNHVSFTAWLMFLIIFMWTPPHFWALALCVKDQYAKAGIPMLPVVKGDERTRTEIFWYSLIMVPLTLSLVLLGEVSWIYSLVAFALGLLFVQKAWVVKTQKTQKAAYSLFGFSIAYLMILFLVMIIDSKILH